MKKMSRKIVAPVFILITALNLCADIPDGDDYRLPPEPIDGVYVSRISLPVDKLETNTGIPFTIMLLGILFIGFFVLLSRRRFR